MTFSTTMKISNILVLGISTVFAVSVFASIYSLHANQQALIEQVERSNTKMSKSLSSLDARLESLSASTYNNVKPYNFAREETNIQANQQSYATDEPYEAIEAKQKRITFDDEYADTRTQDQSFKQTETANDFYQRIYQGMVDDGLSSERLSSIENALSESLSNHGLGVSYSGLACSKYKCIVKSDIDKSLFSVQSYTEDEFSSNDNYTLYVGDLNRSLTEHMGRPVQVSIARFDDEAVISIKPSYSSSGGDPGNN